jgi:hypothetical protein
MKIIPSIVETYHIDFDFLDLEAEDDRPDEAENQSVVSVANVFSANRLQADLRAMKL